MEHQFEFGDRTEDAQGLMLTAFAKLAKVPFPHHSRNSIEFGLGPESVSGSGTFQEPAVAIQGSSSITLHPSITSSSNSLSVKQFETPVIAALGAGEVAQKPLRANTTEHVLAETDTCLHNLQQVTALKLPTLLVRVQPCITDTVEETCAPPVRTRSHHIR